MTIQEAESLKISVNRLSHELARGDKLMDSGGWSGGRLKANDVRAVLQALEANRDAFILLLHLVRTQGWGLTTENNFEYFVETIFPILGVHSFDEISDSAKAIQSKEVQS